MLLRRFAPLAMNSVFALLRASCLAACCLCLGSCGDHAPPAEPEKPKPAPEAVVPPNPAEFRDATAMTPPVPAPSEDPKDHPGFKVETLAAGEGKELVAGKTAVVHYTGTLLNGKQFDSSWSKGVEPAKFALSGVVPGFRMGLLGMKVGEHRRITIPGELGYGPAGKPEAGIHANETLVFDVELVDVVDSPPAPPRVQ